MLISLPLSNIQTKRLNNASNPIFMPSFGIKNPTVDSYNKNTTLTTASNTVKNKIQLPEILKLDTLSADERTQLKVKEAKLRLLRQISNKLEKENSYIWNIDKLEALKGEGFERAIYLLNSEQVIRPKNPININDIVTATRLNKTNWEILKDHVVQLMSLKNNELAICNKTPPEICKEVCETINKEGISKAAAIINSWKEQVAPTENENIHNEETHEMPQYYNKLSSGQKLYVDFFGEFYKDEDELYEIVTTLNSNKIKERIYKNFNVDFGLYDYHKIKLLQNGYYARFFNLSDTKFKLFMNKQTKSLDEFKKELLILSAKKIAVGNIMSASDLYKVYLRENPTAPKIEPNDFYPLFNKIDENTIENLKKINPEIIEKYKGTVELFDNINDVEKVNEFYSLFANEYDQIDITGFVKLANFLDKETFKCALNKDFTSIFTTFSLDKKTEKKLKEKLENISNPQEKLDKFKIFGYINMTMNKQIFEIFENDKPIEEPLRHTKRILSQNNKSFDEKVEELITFFDIPLDRINEFREFFIKHRNDKFFREETTKKKLADISNIKINSLLNNPNIPHDLKMKKIEILKKQQLYSIQTEPETQFTHKMEALLREFLQNSIIETDYLFPTLNQMINTIISQDTLLSCKENHKSILKKLEIINLDPKYRHYILEAYSPLFQELNKLIENINAFEKFEKTRDKLDNYKTKKVFEENGLNYEAFAHNNPNLKVDFSLNITQDMALESQNRQIAKLLTLENYPKAVTVNYKEFIDTILNNEYEETNNTKIDNSSADTENLTFEPFNFKEFIDKILNNEYKVTNNKITKIDNSSADIDDLKTLLERIIAYAQELETTNPPEKLMDFYKYVETPIIPLQKTIKNIHHCDGKEKIYTARFADPNDIGRNLFLGNHVGCCHSVSGGYEEFAAINLINPSVRIMEIVDKNDNSYGNSICYIVKLDDDTPALIIDSFEAKAPLCYSKEVPNIIEKLGKQMLKNMGCPESAKVLFGPSYSSLNKENLSNHTSKTIQLIDNWIGCKDYKDSIGGYKQERTLNTYHTEYPLLENKSK